MGNLDYKASNKELSQLTDELDTYFHKIQLEEVVILKRMADLVVMLLSLCHGL